MNENSKKIEQNTSKTRNLQEQFFENYKSKNCNEVQRKLDETQVIFEKNLSKFLQIKIAKLAKARVNF